jgi:GNAT superfamily N-acetyltransferase
MGEVTIRRAVMEDLPAVIAMLDEVDDLHRKALPWLFRPIDEAGLAGFLEDYISKQDRTMLLATTPEGALAGVLYVFMRQHARAPIVQPTLIAEIDSLVVGHSVRRQGVGTRLVQAALQWAADNGATRTELGVYDFNGAARAFWASVGFETFLRRLVAHTKPGVEA